MTDVSGEEVAFAQTFNELLGLLKVAHELEESVTLTPAHVEALLQYVHAVAESLREANT